VSEKLERWLRANWQYRREAIWPGSPPIEIAVRSQAPRAVDSTMAVAEISALAGMELLWRRVAAREWLTVNGDAGVRLALADDTTRIEIWCGHLDDASDHLLTALHVAICEALRATGLAPLHAAVVTRDGETVALTGRSGVGKSSTLVSAVASGWTPIAEDFAWLDTTTRRVYGWDRGVHLTDDGRARVRDALPAEGWQRERNKQFITFDRLTERRVRGTAPALTRLIELRRDDVAQSSVERLDGHDSVRALWESAGVPLCQASRRRFANDIPALLRHIKIERMVLGRTPIAF
jgi:hypothetical protein